MTLIGEPGGRSTRPGRPGLTSPRAERGGRLRLVDRSLDPVTGRCVFGFDMDGDYFEETLELAPPTLTAPVPAPARGGLPPGALDLLLDACHVVMGTSYFKLRAPRQVLLVRPAPPALSSLARLVYDEGMREFAVRNGLGVPLETEIVAEPADPPTLTRPATAPLPPTGEGVLAPIGGGKDSAAVLTLLPRATGLSVSPTPVQRRLVAAAGVAFLEVQRHLDPRLHEATSRPGAMNGHVPVTAINSAVSVLAALLNGHAAVVMGNERSASEPTLIVGGAPVNHQFSKSITMEAALQRVFEQAGVAYFSLLRQLSELSIAGIVSRSSLRGSFLSCNRAFRLSRPLDSPQGWCLECPKCLFTFLSFTPHVGPGEAEAIFGGNPLAHEHNIDGFRQLWSEDAKPFDCVGERGESALAMARLGPSPLWGAYPVVQALAQEAGSTAKALGAVFEDLLQPGGPHLMPEEYAALASYAASEVATR